MNISISKATLAVLACILVVLVVVAVVVIRHIAIDSKCTGTQDYALCLSLNGGDW